VVFEDYDSYGDTPLVIRVYEFSSVQMHEVLPSAKRCQPFSPHYEKAANEHTHSCAYIAVLGQQLQCITTTYVYS
jgi:hypothetical protein